MTFLAGCWRRWLQTMCLLAAACMLIQTATSGVGAEPEPKWVDAWAVSYLPTTVNGTLQSVPTFYNQTLRLNMFLKLGGTVLRVKLTNRFSTRPLTIGSAHVALRRSSDGLVSGPEVVAETDHALTFAGAKTLKIEAGKERWSDPVELAVRQHQDISVSVFLPEATTPEAFHPVGLKTHSMITGNHCGDATFQSEGAGSRTTMYFFVSGVQVSAPANSKVIVTLGDSITDSAAAVNDLNAAWPDVLSRRMPALKDGTPISVINMGVGSNRLVSTDAAGPAGLKRLEDDVLSKPNVSHLILLEGINDISYEQIPAEKLIAAYEQVIDRAHAKGIKVIGATLLPIQHSRKDTPGNEATRQAVNKWILESHRFDAVLDFEKVVRDPENPLRIRKDLTGDYVHPNTEGYRLMGESIPLDLFE
jgi:lysophospholipase L1-like esterase